MRSQPLGCTNDPPVYLLSTEPCRYSFGVRARLPFNRPPGLEDELWPRLICCRQGRPCRRLYVSSDFASFYLLQTDPSTREERRERAFSEIKADQIDHFSPDFFVARSLDDSPPPYIQHWNRTTCLGCTLGRRVRRVPTLAHLFIRCLRFTLH